MKANRAAIRTMSISTTAGALIALAAVTGVSTASAAPPTPSGYYRGNVTTLPVGNAVWYGKSFHRGGVINNTAIGWAFPGRVYPGRSVQDGTRVIVVDYSGTPVGFVRDELRPDGHGGYWGRSLNGSYELLRFRLTR